MKNTIGILMALSLLGLSAPVSAALNATLDHNQIAPGETVQLTLQHDGQTDTQPDLSPLKQDFDIVGRSSGSSIQIINGKMSSQVQLSLMLLPKHNGKLNIPALKWDADTSQALSLTVSNNNAAGPQGNPASGNAAHVFVTAKVDQTQPYVQAAVPITVRLYADQPLYQASLDLHAGNDVLVQQLDQDRQTSETRNGRTYQVVERKYLLFPQRSGHIRLDGPLLNAQIQDNSNPTGNDPFFSNVFGRNPFAGMVNATRPIRIQGDPVVLNVRPRPAGSNGHDWLPAQNVTLQETWQPDKGDIHAGDPVTRHLHLSAAGLTAVQLPDLSQLMQLPDGLRAYPDQPKFNNDTGGNNIVGTRDQDIAIIASTPGSYKIPALHLFWWDTVGNAQREIDLPARTLDVLPGTDGIAIGTAPPNANSGTYPPPAASSAPQRPENPATNYRWNWVSLVLALLWLATLAGWWRSSRRNSNHPAKLKPQATTQAAAAPGMVEARKAFRHACQQNDAHAARRHLLAWANATWPHDPPGGLNALATRLDDAALTPLLKQLDRACYADGLWQGQALLELKALSGADKDVAQTGMQLAGLYS